MRQSPDILGAPKIWSAGMKCLIVTAGLVILAVLLTNALEIFVDIQSGGEYWTLMDSGGSLYFNHDFLDPPLAAKGSTQFHFGRVPAGESPSRFGATPQSGDMFEFRTLSFEPIVAGGVTYTPKMNSLRISLMPTIVFMAVWILVAYLRNWTRWYKWKGNRFPVELAPAASSGPSTPPPFPLPESPPVRDSDKV